jgi:hypothetical protein
VIFIQRFKFPSYPKPNEIISREYDANIPFEDSFICINLDIKWTEIVLGDDLSQVQIELENIIDSNHA